MSNPSNDAQVMMAYQANQKSMGVAYLLWFFLGSVGAHRFYLGRTGSAVAMLILFLLGWIFIWAMGLGLLLLVPLGIWVLVDALLIPGIVNAQNNQLVSRLSASSTAPTSGVDELAKYAALRESGAISSDEYESQKRRILGVL
jgi:TM2 domain-containing membrane protein YozV